MANDIDFDFFDSPHGDFNTTNTAVYRNESIKIEAKVPSIASDIESDSDQDYASSPRRPKQSKGKGFGGKNRQPNFRIEPSPVNDKRPPRPRKQSNKDRDAWSDHSHHSTDDNINDGRESRLESSRSTQRSYSSDDEEKTRSTRRRRSSFSDSSSSQWSTGSEREKSARRSHKSVSYSAESKKQYHSDDTESSLSVSSLSDVEQESSIVPTAATSSSMTSSQQDHLVDTVDKDRMNLQLLLSALLDGDSDRRVDDQRRRAIMGSDRRYRPPGQTRSNYTFSNDRARLIDLENQRLLKNILAQRAAASGKHEQRQQQQTAAATPAKKKQKKPSTEPVRVTNATVNRMREQQRVERENLALLRRLNQVKPSADISRNKQLEDYHRQMSYYCPQLRTTTGLLPAGSQQITRSKSSQGFRPTSASGRSRPASAGQTRPLSASSQRSSSAYGSPASTGRRRRPASATTRPSSAGRRRPEWETGW